MFNCTLILTSAHGGVSVRNESEMISAENIPGFFRGSFQNNYHKSAHQKSSISLFTVINSTILINFEILILLVINQLFYLFAKKMNFTNIKRTKISKKRLVNQILVDTKIKSTTCRLRWFFVRDPIESIRNDFLALSIIYGIFT